MWHNVIRGRVIILNRNWVQCFLKYRYAVMVSICPDLYKLEGRCLPPPLVPPAVQHNLYPARGYTLVTDSWA